MCIFFLPFFHSFLTHYTTNIRMESIHVFGHSQKEKSTNSIPPTPHAVIRIAINTQHIYLRAFAVVVHNFSCVFCTLCFLLLFFSLVIELHEEKFFFIFCTQKKASKKNLRFLDGWVVWVEFIVASFLRKIARVSYCRSLANDKDENMIVLWNIIKNTFWLLFLLDNEAEKKETLQVIVKKVQATYLFMNTKFISRRRKN